MQKTNANLSRLRTIAHKLQNDSAAGLLLMAAAALALAWANSPLRHLYEAISEAHLGPANLGLNMSVTHWAQDGLLTVFFFVVGLELKQEFVTGSLREPKQAALPMLAAIFGMVGPAALYTTLVFLQGAPTAASGWAIPAATDIAFAMAILAIFGKGLPPAARTFLLTLAVVDDLLGILVIAIFYPQGALSFVDLGLCLLAIAAFGALAQLRLGRWYLLLPLAVLAWYFMYRSGIHATIAGVGLGMVVPAKRRAGEEESLTHSMEKKVTPYSAGVAVPIFAFFAAGVNIVDTEGGAAAMLTHPVAVAVMIALPLGKCLGLFGSVLALTKLTPLRLGGGVDYADILPIAFVAGIGFTVALLIASLAFSASGEFTEAGRLGVVLGTAISALIGALLLRRRVSNPTRGSQKA